MNKEIIKNQRILIVDDEQVNLKLIDKILRSQGYTNLILVQDPRKVLERYGEQRTDLILLDINMPHLDGYQVMEQLKTLNDPLLSPVIILTAQHGRDYLPRALSVGALRHWLMFLTLLHLNVPTKKRGQ
jgi:putative two-component system response regulator